MSLDWSFPVCPLTWMVGRTPSALHWTPFQSFLYSHCVSSEPRKLACQGTFGGGSKGSRKYSYSRKQWVLLHLSVAGLKEEQVLNHLEKCRGLRHGSPPGSIFHSQCNRCSIELSLCVQNCTKWHRKTECTENLGSVQGTV